MSTLLEQASLVLIPSGYKEDVVYSQIPTDGSGDLSFTRASNGTRVNSAGLVEVCPWNVWEGSNDFSATYWSQYQLTPTTGTTSDIYGNSSTVYKLIGSVTNSYSFINRSSNGSANTAFSVYAKPNGYTKIGISNRSTNAWNFVVDLVTKVVSNTNDPFGYILSINVIDAVGDWKRIEVVVSTAIQYNLHPLPSNFNSTNFDNVTLNGTDGVWVMASQANIGSTAKPYFPTTDRLNVPRLTYQNGGGGCPSLLLEKQSTNYLLWSQAFTNTWATYNGTTTDNETISPDGTQNASKVIMGAGNSATIRQAIGGLTNGSTYTFSLYIKQGSGVTAFLDISDTASTVNITPTSEWVRYTYTANWNTSLNFVDIELRGTSGSAYCYIWGAQLEASSYPTSYIPTTSSSATRVADACYKTGISSLIGQTEGVLFADVNRIQKSQNYNVAIFIGLWPSVIDVYFDNSNQIICIVYVSGVLQTTLNGGVLANGRHKIAVAYKQNDFVMYVDGAQVATSSSGSVPTCSQLIIGNDDSTLYHLNDSINEAVIFPTRLTNAELASLTTI